MFPSLQASKVGAAKSDQAGSRAPDPACGYKQGKEKMRRREDKRDICLLCALSVSKGRDWRGVDACDRNREYETSPIQW